MQPVSICANEDLGYRGWGVTYLRRFGLFLMLNPGPILMTIWDQADPFIRLKLGFLHVKQGINIVFLEARVKGNISLRELLT